MLLTTNLEMTDRRMRRRPKVVPRAAADFVRQLKIKIGKKKLVWQIQTKSAQNKTKNIIDL